MMLLVVPGWFKIENSELPWFRRAPELWVYPVQILVCGATLLFFRQHYVFRPWRGLILAVLFATVGIACWILPAWLHQRWSQPGQGDPGWWRWLGVVPRNDGFDPDVIDHHSFWWTAAVGMRFLRMVVIVPLVEEIFWRGFLMRYVIAEERPFEAVPFGTHHWKAFVIVTTGVVLIHNPEDYVGALIWGVLMYGLAVRTRSLGACVAMHAAGNLLLGVYVLQTRQWGFW